MINPRKPAANKISHELATKAAKDFVSATAAAGLDWQDTLTGCESLIAIMVATAAIATIKLPSHRQAYAQEVIETMTIAAHLRVQTVLREFKDGG